MDDTKIFVNEDGNPREAINGLVQFGQQATEGSPQQRIALFLIDLIGEYSPDNWILARIDIRLEKHDKPLEK